MVISIYEEIVQDTEEGEESNVGVEEVKKVRKNPPIFIKEVEKIGIVSKAMKRVGIEADFKSVKGGVQVFTTGSEDYRRALRNVEEAGVRAHWFMLPLKTVVKSIPVGIKEDELKDELVDLGFKVESVVKMKRDKANPFDMVAATSERSDDGKKAV